MRDSWNSEKQKVKQNKTSLLGEGWWKETEPGDEEGEEGVEGLEVPLLGTNGGIATGMSSSRSLSLSLVPIFFSFFSFFFPTRMS